jgi:hypothetical protein
MIFFSRKNAFLLLTSGKFSPMCKNAIKNDVNHEETDSK